jgi:glutathione synthase/RimK-type ligase-like ATP-grasp enzyme/Tfp pilus assembly protein PilF
MDDLESAKQFFFEGLRLLEGNNFQAAETQFARSLELIPDRVSTLNNLSAVKIKLNKFAEAEACARKAVALDENSSEAWLNLGIALNATECHEEALQAFDWAIKSNPAYAMAWLNKAMTLLELKRYDEALPACDQAQKLDSGKHEILYAKSLILKELQRPDEAQMIYRKSLTARVDSSPLFIADRRASQKAEVLIINQNPNIDASLTSFQALQRPNFPGQLVDHLNEDFHFTYVFCGDVTKSSVRKQISPPGFVINNIANGELVLTGGNLSDLIALFDGFGIPVVNHPTKVIKTTRDVSAKLLEDISGVVVPKTMRFSSIGKTQEELVHEIEGQYDYPLITRTLFSQEGKGMTKVDSREALIKVLSSGLPENFFVTQFVDSRTKNEFYRKIRVAFVRDEIIVVRVDYDTIWKIYARKSDERVRFYLANAHLLDEEKRICTDPEVALGRSVNQALRAIRNRIPMDVFGMDFDVDADGRLIFYEANATMNLFSTARKEVPNPKEAEENLKLAFQRYFTTLVARR